MHAVQALKEEKARDNVLPRLMASGDSPDALFREEIKKYDPLVVSWVLGCSTSASGIDVEDSVGWVWLESPQALPHQDVMWS